MQIRTATLEDIPSLVELERKHQNDELIMNEIAMEGQTFSELELTTLVKSHYLVVAEDNGRLVAYVIAAKWAFFKSSPIYQYLLKRLKSLDFDAVKLSEKNSCQYGPIWIHRDYRGQGVFAPLVQALKAQVAKEFAYMVTFIAEGNERSFAAHTQKAEMQVIDFFSFDARDYYLLSTSTTSK